MHRTRDRPRVDRHGEVRRTADRTTRRRQRRITAGVNDDMTHQTSARRRLPAALILTLTLMLLPATTANAAPMEARRVPAKICDHDWRQGPWQIRQLIRCAARRWTVPGGAGMALYVADRESNFLPGAYNPSGAAGIYQHLLSYWPGRATTFGFHGWSAFNARANIIVTMKMVHRGGWDPWT
jgi:soluble lytic murein transglycosylase-like protein